MPAARAIYCTVRGLSPLITRIDTPCPCKKCTVSCTPSRRLDKFYSSLPNGDALRRIESQEQADAYEERAGKILGPCILKYLERKYPEVNKDPTLRAAIDHALKETESDISAAATARKDHLLSKDSDSVRRIGWAIRKKTIATIGIMVAAMYSDERYQLHPKRTSIARAEQLFSSSIRVAYPELPSS